MREVIQIVSPTGSAKNPYYFDLSQFGTTTHDENYEIKSFGITIKTVIATSPESVDIYINGVKLFNIVIGYLHDAGYKTVYATRTANIPGNLSNAEVYATRYNSTTRRTVDITEVIIFKQLKTPVFYEFVDATFYANRISRVKFKGNRACRGLKGTVTNGGSFNEQVIPGSLVFEGNEAIGEILIPSGVFTEGVNEGSVNALNGTLEGELVPLTFQNIYTSTIKILTFEPSGVAQNKDRPVTVTWTTDKPQEQYEFKYRVTGNDYITIMGTTEQKHIFPTNAFGVGTVEMQVRAYNGYVWSEWKTATFITFGKPETPTLTIQAEYDTATPTFTWESIGQVSYRLQILKDEMLVLDSADVYSGVKEHTFTTALENNVVYTARLRIKNQYEYASDWDTKEFTIVFRELQKPRFDMFGDDKLGRVMFNIYNAEGQIDFAYCELYRREYGESEWTKIATDLELNSMYTDYACRSGVLYEYKASAVSLTGGYTDSDIALKEVKLRNTMISDASDHNEYVVLIHNPTKTRGFTKETHAMQYSGLKFPSFEFGEVRYTNMNISFTVDAKTLDKLLDLYYSNNVLLFRDNRGKKIYGHISGEPSVEDAEFMKYTVSFPFTETNFNEGV